MVKQIESIHTYSRQTVTPAQHEFVSLNTMFSIFLYN